MWIYLLCIWRIFFWNFKDLWVRSRIIKDWKLPNIPTAFSNTEDCQCLPKTAENCQRPPKTAKDRQRLPKTAKGCQKPPKTTEKNQRWPKTATDCRRLPKTSEDRRRPPKTTENCQRPPRLQKFLSPHQSKQNCGKIKILYVYCFSICKYICFAFEGFSFEILKIYE